MRGFNAIALMLFASACATPMAPLSEQKANYPKLDVAVIDTDDKVIISLEQPSADPMMTPVMLPPGTTIGQAAAAGAAGGLIAGLIIAGIESAERADAAKDIIPVQEALGDTRFGPSLREAMLESLRDLDWTDIEDVRIINVDEKEALGDYLAATDAPGVLTLASSNFLSRNASTLVFSARATIIPKATEVTRSGKTKIPRATFVTTVGFEVPAPVAGKRRVDFLPTWAENEAELIRAAAAQAEPLLAEMILLQMQDGNIPIEKPEGAKWERRPIHLYGTPIPYRVQVLESRPDGDLVLVDGGTLRFLASEIAPLQKAETSDEIGPFDGVEPVDEVEPAEPSDEIDPSSADIPQTDAEQSDNADDALITPVSARTDETDPLNDLQMAPIGNDSGQPGRFDKIEQPSN